MVMAARVREVTPLLDAAALTAAAAFVLHERLLAGAKWSAEFTSHDHAISCFNAVTADGTLLSLNVLDGIVLCNGKPPNRLPESIVAHPLYARTFGARNCMVVPEAKRGGALTTARPLAGRSYTFLLKPGGALVVHELQPAHDGLPACRYRLLQHDAEWADRLPVRLKKMHSHWLSEDFAAGASGSAALGAMEHADCEAIDETAAEQAAAGRVVVLRPVSFESRESSFVAIVARRATGGGGCAVYRVQESMGDAHPGWLLAHAAGTLDHPVTIAEGSCGATCLYVLAKLEAPRFIEAYVSPDGRMIQLPLPRHALHFELRNGAFHSVAHRGYELAPCQQLADTLQGFTAYLLLASSAPDTAEMIGRPRLRVVVNRARVTRAAAVGGGCSVATEANGEPAAQLQTNVFDEHARFGTLIAPDLSSRLQLAALYGRAVCGHGHASARAAHGHDRRRARDRARAPVLAEQALVCI
jgi:hypothetical protein